jgi:NAD-dependent deacetylase
MRGPMKKIVILTGAGISADSGLKTFRDNDGLWENHRVEEVATPEAFYSNPELVYRFYNLRRLQLKETKPNPAHIAVGELVNSDKFETILVTQNVDDLHERGGAENLIHMHGELRKVKCLKSGKSISWTEELDGTHLCECCTDPSPMRPDIVWFGEMPYQMDEIMRHLSDCDLFISIGTSGHVYPAAGFVQMAKIEAGAECVELNLDESMQSSVFDESIRGRAAEIVPQYIEKLLGNS